MLILALCKILVILVQQELFQKCIAKKEFAFKTVLEDDTNR